MERVSPSILCEVSWLPEDGGAPSWPYTADLTFRRSRILLPSALNTLPHCLHVSRPLLQDFVTTTLLCISSEAAQSRVGVQCYTNRPIAGLNLWQTTLPSLTLEWLDIVAFYF
jgi:hypothetical protein